MSNAAIMGGGLAAELDCFVINLIRQPDRLHVFMERNRATGLDFKIFEAVDGADLNDQSVQATDVLSADAAFFTQGALGNSLSHRKLWKYCSDNEKPIIVFEDDAAIRTDFKSAWAAVASRLGHDWDIVLLGYNTDSVLDIEMIPGCDLWGRFSQLHPTDGDLDAFTKLTTPVAAYRLNNAFGVCGYAVSPHGARQLAKACFPLDNRMVSVPAMGQYIHAYTIDGVMNSCYRTLRAFACFPPLVLTSNDPAESTTVARLRPL